MIYRAAAALARGDRGPAVSGLRQQLQVMALATGASPDWSTFLADGPHRVVGLDGGRCFEWSATVAVAGEELPLLDDYVYLAGPLIETQPFTRLVSAGVAATRR